VNLKPGDVPEPTATSPERGTVPKKGAEEAARCAGAEPAQRRVAAVDSPKFSGASRAPRETVSSEVEVWPTSAAAQRNGAAEASPRGRACAQHLLERLALRTMSRGVRITHLSVAWRHPSLPGAQDAYAARVSFTVAAEGRPASPEVKSAAVETPAPTHVQIPVYLDVSGFVSGPAHISLSAMSVKQPPDAAVERRLLSTLDGRARTHTL
jgi:hypothetical protein